MSRFSIILLIVVLGVVGLIALLATMNTEVAPTRVEKAMLNEAAPQ